MDNILLSSEDFEKYKNIMFTERGYKSLETYLNSIKQVYKDTTNYPIKIKIVLGIPYLRRAHEYATKEDVYRTIIILSQILGKKLED